MFSVFMLVKFIDILPENNMLYFWFCAHPSPSIHPFICGSEYTPLPPQTICGDAPGGVQRAAFETRTVARQINSTECTLFSPATGNNYHS